MLFPDAIIDKVVGDEVMALYLPDMHPATSDRRGRAGCACSSTPRPAERRRLRVPRAGRSPRWASASTIGEAFVGNIGQRALYDFTAVGDVVNTAARLQGEADGGEIVISERVAAGITDSARPREELVAQGQAAPEPAYRIAV